MAWSVIEPHFDAVRDAFCEYQSGLLKPKISKVKLVIDESIHDSERHFAAARDDGLLILVAPQATELPMETLVAILTHEFGHASDFAYPARWVHVAVGEPAVWVEDEVLESKDYKKYKKLWRERSRDMIEWSADSIAFAVTGQHLIYGGDCMLQTFGIERPKGLR